VVTGNTVVFPGASLDVEDNFAFAIGGGVDIIVNEKFSVRAVQLDYLSVRRYAQLEGNLRFSAGIVYKFGEK